MAFSNFFSRMFQGKVVPMSRTIDLDIR